MFSSDNEHSTRNLVIAAFAVVALVIGGFLVVDNVDFSQFGSAEEVVSTEICITPETGTYAGSQICASEEALVNMGLLEREDDIVTVTTADGVTITGLSSTVSSYLPSATPVPADSDDDDEATIEAVTYEPETEEEEDLSNILTVDGFITVTGIPADSHPVRWANNVVQTNSSPLRSAAWILADPGVIGSDDCGSNQSCSNYGEARVTYSQTTEVASYLCPAGGYIKMTMPQAVVSFENNMTFEFEANDDTNHTLLVRCLYDEAGDNNTRFTVTTSHPGSVNLIRYPVDGDYGGFFSYTHLLEDLVAGHGELDGRSSDNCGSSGCTNSLLTLADLNHGTVGIYAHTMPRAGRSDVSGFELLFSNANRPE